MAKDFKLPSTSQYISKITNRFYRKTHREINLVPDIKGEMIKTLKLRNFILFLSIVIASASVGVVVFFGTIAGGQSIAIDNKNDAIAQLSNKLHSYDDLSDFLTIKDQVSNINLIADNKKVLSRTFEILTSLLPSATDPDTIQISKLDVNLSNESPTFTFDAQADAGKAPFIDFNVLESFKKSMEYYRFDYGTYVDRHGNSIPAYCIVDTNDAGLALRDDEGNYYGLWTINAEGCDPAATTDEDGTVVSSANEYNLESYGDQQVVRIWRTPQYESWYHAEVPTEDIPNMTANGVITNVAHFESECINYKIDLRDGQPVKLNGDDNSCMLVPGTEETPGIRTSDSANGRDSTGNLVLRFSAVITFDPRTYEFANHHFIAIPPTTRRNVTDSYSQIQNMFVERASNCSEDDADCNSKSNLNGDK